MDSKTPSHRRRMGYQAFDPNANPMDVQPYKRGSWGYRYYLPDFLDGWENARKDWIKEVKELELNKYDPFHYK